MLARLGRCWLGTESRARIRDESHCLVVESTFNTMSRDCFCSIVAPSSSDVSHRCPCFRLSLRYRYARTRGSKSVLGFLRFCGGHLLHTVNLELSQDSYLFDFAPNGVQDCTLRQSLFDHTILIPSLVTTSHVHAHHVDGDRLICATGTSSSNTGNSPLLQLWCPDRWHTSRRSAMLRLPKAHHRHHIHHRARQRTPHVQRLRPMAFTAYILGRSSTRIKRTAGTMPTKTKRIEQDTHYRRIFHLDRAAFETYQGQDHSTARGGRRNDITADF